MRLTARKPATLLTKTFIIRHRRRFKILFAKEYLPSSICILRHISSHSSSFLSSETKKPSQPHDNGETGNESSQSQNAAGNISGGVGTILFNV